MIIYQIKLPKKQDADAFVKFMQEEYLPAVHHGPSRIGQVTDLKLLQGRTDTNESTHEFFLQAGWSGLSSGNVVFGDEELQNKFKAFGAQLKRVGFYKEVASWQGGKAG